MVHPQLILFNTIKSEIAEIGQVNIGFKIIILKEYQILYVSLLIICS